MQITKQEPTDAYLCIICELSWSNRLEPCKTFSDPTWIRTRINVICDAAVSVCK